MCQDTGTAAIFAKKGEQVWTGANDAEWLSRGVYECFTKENLRYSQVSALDMWKEQNTGTTRVDHSASPSTANAPVSSSGRSVGRLGRSVTTAPCLRICRVMKL